MNGWHGDHAYTFAIGDPGEEVKQLMQVTKESLYKGIEKAIVGTVWAIFLLPFRNIRKKPWIWCGAGVGGTWVRKNMHEDPQVPNYGKRGSGPKLKEGLVLAIEPMINLGKKKCIPKMMAGR